MAKKIDRTEAPKIAKRTTAIKFPNPKYTDTLEGIILVGGQLTFENLVESYRLGIFPWPHEGYPLLWFCPDERGILDFADLHVPTSLKKWIKKNQQLIRVSRNEDFAQVIRECRLQKRKGQRGTWITEAIERNYIELAKKGKALCVECWQGPELVGGIYGVLSKKYFSCESMFFKKSNMSKYAFLKLVEYLEEQGFNWMDLQMVTDVSESFGAKYISKDDFLQRIS